MKPTDNDADLRALFTRPGFRTWKDKVASVHGCAAPIKLRGSSIITHKATGKVLKDTVGSVWVPCGTRREKLCPTCAAWYADDAFHLIRSGLDGDTAKGISPDVAERPRWFATLTPPSFGPVHSRVVGAGGRLKRPCSCGEWHSEHDTRLGTAIDPDAYDYEAAVLWQAHAGKLWHRFTIALRRHLAHAAGMRVAEFRDAARLSYAKVAEYQRRGLVHFHAAIRLDGPEGAATRAPAWATKELLADAIRAAAEHTVITVARSTGEVLELRFGAQLDLRDITTEAGGSGEINDEADIRSSRLASYIAKYATKSTGAHDGPDRKLRSIEDIDRLSVSAHHKAMMRTAWELGGLPAYEELHLRRWAHMLGFRGHFLTKSRAWSTTLGELRNIRARFRLAETLAALEVAEDDVLVVNDWEAVGFGHDTDAEREYAAAIAEALLERKLNRDNKRGQDR
ncbi:replication initiation protein [Glycomyces sp. TRM65418]|uniref:replication initiator n=1 Tax=Glycomyces sp. TRM65418 TaxID=2867006 RepID=UPI001CE503A8|nr:replication initiator [Glycomyces sp. TRM65418]MCC3765193.1 replication initiation protein [Glycomyces sp. TRM65418]QZD54818.1 replication initiation protein [Glycomyces sp. TRM65418]